MPPTSSPQSMRFEQLLDAIFAWHDAQDTRINPPVVIRTAEGDMEIANVVWDAERNILTLEAGATRS